MKLLLDTHFVLAILREELAVRHPAVLDKVIRPGRAIVSAVNLWEISIKTRLGKLNARMPIDEICGFLDEVAIPIIPIDKRHAVASANPEPSTNDPFDRLLLAQCAVEGMQLVTFDRALEMHPLAWRA